MAAHTRPRRATASRTSPAPGSCRHRRSRLRLAAGVLLAVVCALLIAEGRAQAGSRQPVLALARPVTAGQVITTADLEVVQVSAGGPVSLIPASRQDRVAGSTAAVTLPAGSLLAAGDIGVPPPARGQARLGVVLAPGRYPPDLSPGQHVEVLATRAPGTAGPVPAQPAGQGVVLSLSAAPASGAPGETVVELLVPQDLVPRAAAANAAGQISLAAIPAGGESR